MELTEAGGAERTALASVLSHFLHLLAADAAPGRVLVDDEVLRRLSAAAVDLLQVDAAGVMFLVEGRLRSATASASQDSAGRMAQLQELLQEGPCQDVLGRGEVVVEADLRTTVQWPRYGPAAAAAGWGSVASVPVIGRGRTLAVLDLLRHAPGPFPAAQLALASTLADVAAAYLLMASDRREADRIRVGLARQALYDELTGLANRALLDDRLAHELSVAQRSGAPLAVLFVDLDRFKDVNDTLGHAAGDELLVEIGHRLTATVRAPDTVARVGGDEFVVVCPDLPEQPGGDRLHAYVSALARRLQDAVAAPVVLAGEEVVVSASIGAAIAGKEHQRATDLLRDADAAMYAVKRRRSPVVVDLRDDVASESRLSTARDLRVALQGEQLRVLYQPIRSLDGRREEHLEALVRWQHPYRGLLAPSQFLPVAESSGLMVSIGQWVLEQVCAFAVRWQPGTDCAIAVNVSGNELAEPGFAGHVRGVLERHGLEPGRLQVELTENVLLDPGPVTGRTVEQLRAAGVRICLDDFGTGFSSLSHLERFSVDTLKIDQVFTRRLADRQGAGIVAGVIALARALDLDIVAEGVEHQQQHDLLTRLGCDYEQGWLVGQPQPAEALLDGVRRASTPR